MEELTENRQALKRKFIEHFESADYAKRLRETCIITDKDGTQLLTRTRVILDTHELREHDPTLLKDLLNHPVDALPSLEEAIKDVVDEDITKLLQENDARLHVGVDGHFGRHTVSPRDLNCRFLGKIVKVYGIVIRCSLVRPKVAKSVHFCEATKLYTSREYRDITSLTGPPTGASYPTRDDFGNLLVTEYGLCKYRDFQSVILQELPETAPAGQMPRSVEVLLENDLVDSCKPGDRVGIVGLYRAHPPAKGSSGPKDLLRSSLIANNVECLNQLSTQFWTPGEADIFRSELSKLPRLLDTLALSLAPSIHGHHMVKRGLVLMLVGGQEKVLDTGTHLRGDINCMLVGDPGVAKSQMLRAVMKVAPHAVSTSGRGSSGVGLTAAVTTDSETGEKRLEAGAMVLADRGVVCIDEFDKMSDLDRVAIHEVMEQQTVTIAKAGIHTSLNARCSVFSAANPLFGTYDPSIPITKNINLPDSLLSRFDLLFIVRDHIDGNHDREIASHVAGQHRFRSDWDDATSLLAQDPGQESRSLDTDVEAASLADCYMKYDARLHGPRVPGRMEPLRTGVLRKYIAWLKTRYSSPDGRPLQLEITEEAMEEMTEYFAQLRQSQVDRALPVTARTLETMIRLSTAHAKLCLKMEVGVEDVAVAKELMDYVMKSESSGGDAPTTKAAAAHDAEDTDMEDDNAAAPGGGNGDDNDDDDDDDDDDDLAPRVPPATDRPASSRQTRSTRSTQPSAPSQSAPSSGAATKPPSGSQRKAAGKSSKGHNQDALEAASIAWLQAISNGAQTHISDGLAFLAERGVQVEEAELVKMLHVLHARKSLDETVLYHSFTYDEDDTKNVFMVTG